MIDEKIVEAAAVTQHTQVAAFSLGHHGRRVLIELLPHVQLSKAAEALSILAAVPGSSVCDEYRAGLKEIVESVPQCYVDATAEELRALYLGG